MEVRNYLERFLFDKSKQRQKVASLSGGERARVALAKILMSGANLLLLDEPTNDLDVATLSALEELLETWPGCVLVVSHDRYFLDRVATSMLVFEEGARVVRYPGNYSTYVALRPPPPERTPIKKSASIPAPPPERKGLRHAERLELDGIVDLITAAEARVAALEKELSDPALYTSRAADAKQLTVDLAAARSEVERLTARWELLEAQLSRAR
jgi:ABC transport system ATP-binding/permease protein